MRDLIKYKRQDDDMNYKKEVKVLAVKIRKVVISTISAKLAEMKLLTALTKIVLIRDERDVSVRKVWI